MPDVYGLTTYGRVAIASALKGEEFWLAWGDLGLSYPESWTDFPPHPFEPVKIDTLTRQNGLVDSLTRTNVLGLISVSQSGYTYNQPGDYVLNGNQVDWSPPGAQPIQGSAYQAYYRYRDESPTVLINELGRQVQRVTNFMVRDNNGAFDFNGVKYSITTTPTNILMVQFEFPSLAASDKHIFQLGLYLGTQRAGGVPSSVTYLTPNQMASRGSMLVYENITPLERLSGKREYFNYLMIF